MGHAFAGLWQQQYHYDRTRYHPDHRQQRQHGARDEFRIDLCVGIRSRRLAPHPSPNHRVHPTNRNGHATASTAPGLTAARITAASVTAPRITAAGFTTPSLTAADFA